jgi:hypothetical protein
MEVMRVTGGLSVPVVEVADMRELCQKRPGLPLIKTFYFYCGRRGRPASFWHERDYLSAQSARDHGWLALFAALS